MALTAKPKRGTEQQRRFFIEYEKDGNGTQAAIRAGYAPKSAYVTASRLLKLAKDAPEHAKALAEIHAEVQAKVAERTDGLLADAAYVVAKAVEIVEYGTAMRPVIGMFGVITDDTGSPVLEMTDPKAANSALALLAKRHPEFSDPGVDSGARHLHLHNLTDGQLKALASGLGS